MNQKMNQSTKASDTKKKSPVSLPPVSKWFAKYKYVAVVLLVGILIILWPSADSSRNANTQAPIADEKTGSALTFSLAEKEERLALALSQIEGAGEVVVVLSLRTSLEQEIAVDEDGSGRRETVTIARGGGVQSEVTLRYHYPEFQGALVVSEGANDPSVQLRLTQAVAALTGLRTDRITISPMARDQP